MTKKRIITIIIIELPPATRVSTRRHSDLFGAYGERQLQNLMGSIGANALFGIMSPKIDNWAHLGGLMTGAAIAFATGPNLMVVGGSGGKRRTVVNRPLLQTYVGEFVREFRDDGGGERGQAKIKG